MTDLFRVRETDGVPAPSDFELAAPHMIRLYDFNCGITALGITLDREGFHNWLHSAAFNIHTLNEWLRLYGEFYKALDARDEGQTQADALI